MAEEAEIAAYKGNMRDLYSTIKKLSGKFNKPQRPVKSKDGQTIPEEEGQKRRWVE